MAVKWTSKSSVRSRRSGTVICTSNDGYPSSLEIRKVYEFLSPLPGDPNSRLRVIDESGEDYLYPRRLFCPVSLPQPVLDALSFA